MAGDGTCNTRNQAHRHAKETVDFKHGFSLPHSSLSRVGSRRWQLSLAQGWKVGSLEKAAEAGWVEKFPTVQLAAWDSAGG